jgi:hypothetical protein
LVPGLQEKGRFQQQPMEPFPGLGPSQLPGEFVDLPEIGACAHFQVLHRKVVRQAQVRGPAFVVFRQIPVLHRLADIVVG